MEELDFIINYDEKYRMGDELNDEKGDKGFSVSNLKYIKRWFGFYVEGKANRQQPVDDLGMAKGLFR